MHQQTDMHALSPCTHKAMRAIAGTVASPGQNGFSSLNNMSLLSLDTQLWLSPSRQEC